jgi:hypothetical protein
VGAGSDGDVVALTDSAKVSKSSLAKDRDCPGSNRSTVAILKTGCLRARMRPVSVSLARGHVRMLSQPPPLPHDGTTASAYKLCMGHKRRRSKTTSTPAQATICPHITTGVPVC